MGAHGQSVRGARPRDGRGRLRPSGWAAGEEARETRRSPSRLAELLHPDFEELARSGGRYTRAEVLAEFSPGDEFPEVVARGFELASLSEELALLTYTSAHVDESGELHRFTLRASLWVLTPDGWRLRFHQGTPTDGFWHDPS